MGCLPSTSSSREFHGGVPADGVVRRSFCYRSLAIARGKGQLTVLAAAVYADCGVPGAASKANGAIQAAGGSDGLAGDGQDHVSSPQPGIGCGAARGDGADSDSRSWSAATAR